MMSTRFSSLAACTFASSLVLLFVCRQPGGWPFPWTSFQGHKPCTRYLTDSQQAEEDVHLAKGLQENVKRSLEEKSNATPPQDGFVIQVGSCPQAITSEKALANIEDSSLPGNIMSLSSFIGRAGNNFIMVSNYLSLAYCCKSRLLTLPRESTGFPSPDGGTFKSPQRWFDFSNAVMPLPEFDDLASNSSICPPEAVYRGKVAYRLGGLDDSLIRCMNRVALRGCEAKYLGTLVRKGETCARGEGAPNSRAGDGEHPSPRLYGKILQVPSEHPPEPRIEDNLQVPSPSLSLVMHIRSGDIFGNAQSSGKYGQPPLGYYLSALSHRKWSSVTILTYSPETNLVNPTYTMLDILANKGMLGPNVKTFMNRPLILDLQDMLCADALAVSKSTLHFLTLAHTRAQIFFVPDGCGGGKLPHEGRYYVQSIREIAILLLKERPWTEVYGIDWATNASAYGVYQGWKHSPSQYVEMLLSEEIKGFEKCTLPSEPSDGKRKP